ncbi:MAG: helix-turn-helix domain-containing protein [Sphingobium sp.]|nr:helix-turn-helix domain-containing protein [Sphingobium sp.]
MDGPVHPELIKAQLRIRYGSMRRFEEEKGLPAGAISQVINQNMAWLVVAQVIADELGIPLHRVSKHFYKKLALRPISRKRRTPHRQNAEAK